MKRAILITMSFIVLAIIAVGAVFIVQVFQYLETIDPEYNTAEVIREVTTYVQDNNGDWPDSWSDLDVNESIHEDVVIRFDVTSEQILENPDLIHEVIVPSTGQYRTYPYAQSDLEYLLKVIRELRTEIDETSTIDAGDSVHD